MRAPETAPAAAPTVTPPRSMIAIIGAGIFVTGFGWPGLIGRLPFGLLLKNQLHLPALRVSTFWAVATLAWYLKPIIGFVCDAYPLGGTRRRGYLLTFSSMAGLFWLGFAFVPRSYGWLMLDMTFLNVAMATVSTAVGGLQVEAAQRYGAPGRLASLRSAVEGVMDLLAGPVGGWLAVIAFAWTAAMGAGVLLAFVPLVALLYREPRGARADLGAVWSAARQHLRAIVASRAMWAATGLLFLVYLAPGFQTPILYYQQDVLKLDPRFMGLLQLLGGVGGIAGSAVYVYLCRRIPLKISLSVGIAVAALSTLLYLRYDSATAAVVIDTSAAFVGALATLPLYDLAARATPPGVESFGFSLMMSIRNIAIFAISNQVGSYLYDHHVGFKRLVWINASSTAAVLLFVPLLPRALLASREG
jgi:BT1 family protein